MKKNIFLLLSLLVLFGGCDTDDQDHLAPNMFEDLAFWQFCLDHYDTDSDGGISKIEAEAVKLIDLSAGYGILSLKGIEYFTELVSLNASNNFLEILDLSKNPKIKFFDFQTSRHTLTALVFADKAELEELYTLNTAFEQLDLSSCKKLKKAQFANTYLTELDFSACVELEELICRGDLQNVSGTIHLLERIDLAQNTKLKKLECSSMKHLKGLDLSACVELEDLNCSLTKLNELDLSANTKLKFLNCSYHHLQELDLSNNRLLTSLYCYSDFLPELVVYVWPGFEGIAENDYSGEEGYVRFIVRE